MTSGWRSMLADDLEGVVRLADTVHANFPEERAVFEDRLRLFPAGCFVYAGSDGAVQGYCVSHPWQQGPPPALNTVLGSLPEVPDSYFIHDLALGPDVRGKGLGALLLPKLLRVGRALRLDQASLVAVSGSGPFWRRMGFVASSDETVQAYVREAYGGGATHMIRPLDDIPD